MKSNWTQPQASLTKRLAEIAARLHEAIPLLVAAQTKALESMARTLEAGSTSASPISRSPFADIRLAEGPGPLLQPPVSSLQPASGGDS